MKTLVYLDTQSISYDFSSKQKCSFLNELGDYTLCISYYSYLEILAKKYNTPKELSIALSKLFSKKLNYSISRNDLDIDTIIDDVLLGKITMVCFHNKIIKILNLIKFEYVVARCVVEHFIYYLIEKSGGVLPNDSIINKIIDDYNNNQYQTLLEKLNLASFADTNVETLLVEKSKLVKRIMNIISFKSKIKTFFKELEEVQIINLIDVFCRRNQNIIKPLSETSNMGTVLGFDLYYQVFKYLESNNNKTREPKINDIIDFYNVCLIGENSLLLTRDKMPRLIISQLANNLQRPYLMTNKRINETFNKLFNDKNNITKIFD